MLDIFSVFYGFYGIRGAPGASKKPHGLVLIDLGVIWLYQNQAVHVIVINWCPNQNISGLQSVIIVQRVGVVITV